MDEVNKVEVHTAAIPSDLFELFVDGTEIHNVMEWSVGGEAGGLTAVTIKFYADIDNANS